MRLRRRGVPDTAFVKIVPGAATVYVGQTFPVEVDCYCQDNVANIQMPQLSSDDFIIADLPNSRQRPPRVRVGQTTYNLFSFQTTATAIKAGTFPLGPATWSLAVVTGQRNFFGMAESHQANFSSDAPEIQVLPVPADGAPPAFNGALGDFSLAEYEASPTSVGVGDPITLKVRIAGRGAFDTVTLPANNNADGASSRPTLRRPNWNASDPVQDGRIKILRAGHHPAKRRGQRNSAVCFQLF